LLGGVNLGKRKAIIVTTIATVVYVGLVAVTISQDNERRKKSASETETEKVEKIKSYLKELTEIKEVNESFVEEEEDKEEPEQKEGEEKDTETDTNEEEEEATDKDEANVEEENEEEEKKPKIYLTFDDGPSKYLDGILNTLDEHQAKGTFFFIGSSLGGLSDEQVDQIKEGEHGVGSHTWTHNKDDIYTQNQFIEENKRTLGELDKLGFTSNIIRAPYGSTYMSDGQIENSRNNDWRIIDWHIDSRDWELKNAEKAYRKVLSQLEGAQKKYEDDGIVVLFHENDQTVKTLELLIPELEERGFDLISEEQKPMKEHVFRGR